MMKKYNHGMVLGKFFPPHNGHLYLIDTAIEQCHRVTLFICSLPTENIPGKLRYDWLAKIYKKATNLTIIHIDEELPQTPDEHGDIDDFYRIWCNMVHSHVSDLDTIFTSEVYGDEFAGYLGIEHVLVDLQRSTYPVSGTSIRANPYDNWEHIIDTAKPYFKKKILIMGTESTGKTTLVNRLSECYNSDVVTEYGRDFTDTIPVKKMPISDFELIAVIHDKIINSMVEYGSSPLVFIDTDAIITKTFGEMYLGYHFKSKKIDTIIDKQSFDLILLCDIDVPWVDDGTRDFPNDRKRHMQKIKKELKLSKRPYIMIRGDYDERFKTAKKAINNLIQQ